MPTLADCLDFLEHLGADASLRAAEPSDLTACLAGATLSPALWKAILDGDAEALATLLGRSSPVCCLIAPAKEDEEEEEEEETPEEETPEEEEPDDEDGRSRNVAASGVASTR